MIGVINKSTLVTMNDASLMARACYSQVRSHVAPAWGQKIMPVVFYPDEKLLPPGAWAIAILDDSDQANALGWHTEDQGDLIYGRVFARPVLDNGGAVLTGDLSVSSVLSHEVVETYCDPHINGWCDNGQDALVALEACDPVESDSYAVKVLTSGVYTTVMVSNFVTPAWFDVQAAPGSQFDHMGKVTQPWQMTSGGYMIKMVAGKVSQVFGEEYPAWKKATKNVDTARTARRG